MNGTQDTFSETVLRNIERALMRVKSAGRSVGSWTCEFKAAVLAGIRANLELAHELVASFGVKMSHRSEWGKSPTVMRLFYELIGQPA